MPNLVDLVSEYGVKNLVFYVPMRPISYAGLIPGIAFKTSNSEECVVECRIDETRYKVSDNYKVTLKCIDERFGKEHYYISDLEQLFDSSRENDDGRFRCFVEHIDGYTELVLSRFD